MTDSNRTQVAYVAETTLGTTPTISATTPMRLGRITGESLNFNIQTTRSNELRSDRQLPDVIITNAASAGDLQFEVSYPVTRSFLGDMLAASLYSSWAETPLFENWATADSNITDAGTVANTYAVPSGGTAVVAGHLVRASGFTNSANNQLFKVASSTATTIVGTSLSLTAETAPPVGARLKVVGFEGATADLALSTTAPLGGGVIKLVATAGPGWNTITGLLVGSRIKISGFTATQGGVAGGNNIWARVVGWGGTSNRELYLSECEPPTGGAIPYVPTAESGTGKTVRVWFGDVLRNGTTRQGFTIEKGFLAQGTPNYALYKGLVPGQLSLNYEAGNIATGSISFMGMGHSISTTPQATTFPNLVPATTYDVLNCVSNIGRVFEGGSVIGSPNNLMRTLTMSLNNNLREQPALGTLGPAGIGTGYFDVTGTARAYFSDATYYNKYLNGTRTSLAMRIQENTANTRGLFMTLPVVEYTQAQIVAQGANQDVMVDLSYTAIIDTLTNCMLQFDRLEEWA